MHTDEPILVDWKRLKACGWPYSRVHTYRLIKYGEFPKPLKFGRSRGSRTAWRWKDICTYLDQFRPDDV